MSPERSDLKEARSASSGQHLPQVRIQSCKAAMHDWNRERSAPIRGVRGARRFQVCSDAATGLAPHGYRFLKMSGLEGA
jgi:hypothetical protein